MSISKEQILKNVNELVNAGHTCKEAWKNSDAANPRKVGYVTGIASYVRKLSETEYEYLNVNSVPIVYGAGVRVVGWVASVTYDEAGKFSGSYSDFDEVTKHPTQMEEEGWLPDWGCDEVKLEAI